MHVCLFFPKFMASSPRSSSTSVDALVGLASQIRQQLGQIATETFVQVPEGDIVILDKKEYDRKKRCRRLVLAASLMSSVASFIVVVYNAANMAVGSTPEDEPTPPP
jgi:hypothetical protein